MSVAESPVVQRLIDQQVLTILTDDSIFNMYGPVVLSAMIACLFQGFVFTMCVWYFLQFARKDHILVRCTMLLIVLSTTIETVLVMIKCIKQLIIHPLDALYVFELYKHPDEFLVLSVANISITICQAYLCWRCFRFAVAMRDTYTRSVRIGLTVIGVIAAFFLATSVIGTVMLPVRLSQAYDLLPALASGPLVFWFYFTFSVFVCLDLMIVVVTTTQHRAARTGFAESNTILNTIVNLSLRNGLVILLAQTAQLVLYHTTATSAWVLLPHSFLSRLYAITVFSTVILPRTAQSQLRERQADQEEAMLNDKSIMHPPVPRFSLEGYRSETPGRPSSSYTRCVNCAGGSVTPSLAKSGKGGPTLRHGYRVSATPRGSDSTVVGAAELGVTLHPSEKSYSEDDEEGPVSFTAALFGTPDLSAHRKSSPEIGVDSIESRQRTGPTALEVGDWSQMQVDGYRGPGEFGLNGARRASREPGTGLGLPSGLFRSPSL